MGSKTITSTYFNNVVNKPGKINTPDKIVTIIFLGIMKEIKYKIKYYLILS